MLAGDKGLKDTKQSHLDGLPETDTESMSVILSYTKTNKLITALYMVTDIIDNEEPIRNKLRTLGAGIISDIHSAHSRSNACSKIYEIMSFLDIAFAINIISEMNCNILRKEFSALNQSIKESTDKVEVLNRQINLSDLFEQDLSAKLPISRDAYKSIGPRRSRATGGQSIGHQRTRIGVQKGSTLMQALSDKTHFMSDININNFDVLKKQRRDDIVKIIKIIGGSATIKDIKDKIKAMPDQAGLLISCSEKTLQRELLSMIKDGVLKKTGEKRWSRYFLV